MIKNKISACGVTTPMIISVTVWFFFKQKTLLPMEKHQCKLLWESLSCGLNCHRGVCVMSFNLIGKMSPLLYKVQRDSFAIVQVLLHSLIQNAGSDVLATYDKQLITQIKGSLVISKIFTTTNLFCRCPVLKQQWSNEFPFHPTTA